MHLYYDLLDIGIIALSKIGRCLITSGKPVALARPNLSPSFQGALED